MRPELYGIDIRSRDINHGHASVTVEWSASDPLERGTLDGPDHELDRARRWAAGIVGRVVVTVTERVMAIAARPGAHYCPVGTWEGCGITQIGLDERDPNAPWEAGAFITIPDDKSREVVDLCRDALAKIAADTAAGPTVSRVEGTAPAPRGHLAVVKDEKKRSSA